MKARTGGKRDDTCDLGLSRSWTVEVCEKKKKEKKEGKKRRKKKNVGILLLVLQSDCFVYIGHGISSSGCPFSFLHKSVLWARYTTIKKKKKIPSSCCEIEDFVGTHLLQAVCDTPRSPIARIAWCVSSLRI